MSKELIFEDYVNDLKEIKETIRQNQNKAMVYVNSQMILTYYKIGTIINKRKTWGSKYIKKLSQDLCKYGKGYSIQNLKYMSQFASEFDENEFSQQPVGQIPWGTLVTVIIPKSHSHNEMLYYINETHKNGWSRSMVLNQIELKAYERSQIEPLTTLVNNSNDEIKEVFKDTYVFEFLDKESLKSEKDLKNSLIDNVIKFLQELGPGFCLVGKEYRINTPTMDDYYIDLLMYHNKIHAYVVIEVKIGKFKPSDLGQLIFYVNAIDDIERTEGDNDTIGLILCKDSDSFVAKTSLNKVNIKLGISKYKIIEDLPEYLEKRMKEIEYYKND